MDFIKNNLVRANRHTKQCRSLCSFVVLVFLLLTLSGCASKQAYTPDSRDSLEGFNRSMFQVHQSVDFFAITPVAHLYGNVFPQFFRSSITNFFANLDDVPNAVNSLLQGELKSSWTDMMRLLINSTLGLFGLFDVASQLGFDKHNQDFGRTLATWGIGSGSYFVIPIIGTPSTLRDFPASIVDYIFNPISYLDSSGLRLTLVLIRNINKRQQFFAQEKIIREWSPDFYSSLRSYYLAQREYLTGQGLEGDDDLYDDLKVENESETSTVLDGASVEGEG